MRVLAIGAHFDDVELGCGGTLARHILQNDDVFIYVVTNSGYSNYDQEVIRRPEDALSEGKKAIEILEKAPEICNLNLAKQACGQAQLICGDFITNHLQPCDELVVSILQLIDSYDIDIVYSHWSSDIHLDHQAVAKATLHASRHIPRLLQYRSNYYTSNEPFHGNFYVDISQTLKVEQQMIKAHATEYERIGNKWLDFFTAQNLNDGQRIGVEFAECFEVIKYLN